jgi:hypothetical protein
MRALSLLFLWLALCAALPADAAYLSGRSPVRMGLWWDPQHSGSGFELFRGTDEVAAIWYTYREDGTPLWYSAIARFDKAGAWTAPLMQHRWANGAHAGATQVGELSFQRNNFESIALRWRIGAREGSQALVPFPVSGIVPEVDHSGAWFEPRRSGYGLSLTEQGEWLGGVLYFYDGAGQPTWAVGNNDGQGTTLRLQMQTGGCPGCASRGSAVLGQGTLALRLDGDARMQAQYLGSGPAAWPLEGELVQVSLPASRRPADRQLAAFDGAAELKEYLEEALLAGASVPEAPSIDFSPAPAPESFSMTNVQEAGVDEADRLKTDGRWIYSATHAGHQDRPAIVRVAEVSDGAAQLAVRDSFALPQAANGLPYSGLYLTDARLVALASSQPRAYGGAMLWFLPAPWQGGKTLAMFYDRGTPEHPPLRTTLEFDAHLVASRRVGGKLYLVLRSFSALPELTHGATPGSALDLQNRALVRATPLEQLLPKVRIDGGQWQPLLQPQDVQLPVYGERAPSPELVTVVAIDVDAPGQIRSLAVVGRVDAVYVSTTGLYVANSRSGTAYGSPIATPSYFHVTDVHKVALGADGPALAASGSVEGYLDRDVDRAPYRFSEHAGKLRLVTVSNGLWGARGVNRLTVLEPSAVTPKLLRTVSYLPNRERPEPLGKPGEQLYGTRFIGDTLYAVTFLKVDPLYVVDLSDPAAPRIAGEVELPGYSDYLHPVGEDLLLGIGYDAYQPPGETFAWFQGLQFTLFDVRNPAQPRVLEQRLLGKRPSASAALYDPHALSVMRFGAATRFTLPVRVHESDGSEGPAPAPSYYYPWSWSGLQTLEVSGDDAASARLTTRTSLVTHRRTAPGDSHYDDDAVAYARSIQFARGTVYVEGGRFWLARADGGLVSGPQ